jgi:tetratricopeptide (TPR) repeat protein
MNQWHRMMIAGALAFGTLTLGGQELQASKTLTTPRLPKNKKLSPYELGKLIYNTDEYVGKDGKNCAACHETKLPLRRDSLAKRKNELPKQIQWCLATRVKNEDIEPGTPEFAGIMEYIYTTYGLHQVVDEDPKVERLMNLGSELFADGDFDGAKTYLERALPSLKSKYHVAQTHVILGIIYHVLAEPDLAKDHFQKAVEADPTIDVNPSLFSPKTVELFYSVKRRIIAGAGEEEK